MAPKSWLAIPSASHFSLANIPFGIVSTADSQTRRPAVAVGEYALDLAAFSSDNGFSGLTSVKENLSVFSQPTLNAFAALGRSTHREVRMYLQDVLSEDTNFPEVLKHNVPLQKKVLIPLKEVESHLPMHIGHYTDFYAGSNHAYNVGTMFRGASNALQPNYTHLPVGYNGRASSVVVSGTPIRRPWGQILENPTAEPKIPTFAPCRKLDFELELGAFLCRANNIGEPVRIQDAEESIFGYVLLNDWSARDIQAWEYVPLGPFNSKNFGTTISPWVLLVDALEPFMTEGLKNDTELLPYLKEKRRHSAYSINLEVDLKTSSGSGNTIARTNSKNLIFSFPQMLAHHSITGCPMQIGDLLGSGTISGTEPGTQGSLLEQSLNGKTSLKLNSGEERAFLEDGDSVTFKGWAGTAASGLVGFGECAGLIMPAIKI